MSGHPSGSIDEAADWVVDRLLARAEVEERPSRFADKAALFVRGREFFHLDAPGLADVRLGRSAIRANREALRADHRVELRSDTADWVNVRFESLEDAAIVLRWAETAIEAAMGSAGKG